MLSATKPKIIANLKTIIEEGWTTISTLLRNKVVHFVDRFKEYLKKIVTFFQHQHRFIIKFSTFKILLSILINTYFLSIEIMKIHVLRQNKKPDICTFSVFCYLAYCVLNIQTKYFHRPYLFQKCVGRNSKRQQFIPAIIRCRYEPFSVIKVTNNESKFDKQGAYYISFQI